VISLAGTKTDNFSQTRAAVTPLRYDRLRRLSSLTVHPLATHFAVNHQQSVILIHAVSSSLPAIITLPPVKSKTAILFYTIPSTR
jgi:hypothetical protein